MLAREHELRACELHGQVAETCERVGIPRARGPDELLGLLPKLLEVHPDLLP